MMVNSKTRLFSNQFQKLFLTLLLTISLIMLASCGQTSDSNNLDSDQLNNIDSESQEPANEQETEVQEPVEEPQAEELIFSGGWQDTQLTSLLNDESFSITELLQEQKPILLETFAVWCPTCKRQQQEIQELHGELGDDVISIALNVDPNEDADQVINHATENNFDWRFSISPVELTQELINQFGITIASAPQAPIVLICADGSSELLSNGLKKVDELKDAIATCI